MKTKCCNQKIENNERFCLDCGWEAHVYNEDIQMEFEFMKYLLTVEEQMIKLIEKAILLELDNPVKSV